MVKTGLENPDKDLTIAYMVGYHKRDDLVLALRKRVEALENDPRFSISVEQLEMALRAISFAMSADTNFQSDEFVDLTDKLTATSVLLQHQD